MHEAVVSHVRRLLSTKLVRKTLYETPAQLSVRMPKVEHHLHYEMDDGELPFNLGKDLHKRRQDLQKPKGERLPK